MAVSFTLILPLTHQEILSGIFFVIAVVEVLAGKAQIKSEAWDHGLHPLLRRKQCLQKLSTRLKTSFLLNNLIIWTRVLCNSINPN
jgi:hypothetical protein